MEASPLGEHVALGLASNQVALVDAKTFVLLGRLGGRNEHEGGDSGPMGVHALAFSPEGRTLAAAGRDNGGRITLWDVGQRKKLFELQPPDGIETTALAFFGNGRFLASGGTTGLGERGAASAVYVWDLDRRSLRNRASAHSALDSQEYPRSISALTISPDGTLLASAGGDGTCILWRNGTSDHKQLKGRGESVIDMAFSRDGQMLACLDRSGEVVIYDALTLSARKLQATWGSPERLLFIADQVVGWGGDRVAFVCAWDSRTGRTLGHQVLSFGDAGLEPSFANGGNWPTTQQSVTSWKRAYYAHCIGIRHGRVVAWHWNAVTDELQAFELRWLTPVNGVSNGLPIQSIEK